MMLVSPPNGILSDLEVFWRNLLPNGTYDDRVIHKILTNEEVFSANVFIDEEFWRPAWWEVS